MKFDEILQIVGTFGRWHKIFFLAIIPLFVVTAHHMVATVFSQATPNFRCRLPHENSNAKYKLPTEEMDKNYPIDKSTKTYSTCTIYQNGTNSEEIECDNYIYDDSVYKETVITLLNMVCSNAYLAATSDSCFMVGYLLGSFIAGWLSDRFGRKLILYISLVLQLVFSVWIIFSYNYACYAAGRFGDGAVTESVFLVAYVLEWVSMKFWRWHQIKCIFLIPIFIVVGYHMVAAVFYQAEPKFRCGSSSGDTKYNLSKEEMDKNYPINSDTGTYEQCLMYKNGTNSEKVACDNYVYDDSYYGETATTLFRMVCKNDYLSANTHSGYMAGYLIGSFASGWLSDRFGRKKILCISLAIQLGFGVMICLSFHYAMYFIGRLGDGIASAAVNVVCYVLVTELVVPKHRLYAGQAAQLAFACGYMLVGLHAYLIRHWRYLYAVLCAPGIIFLGYWFVVPESPRWLLSTKQEEAAMKVVKNIAKWNKVDLSLPENDISEMIKPNVPAAVDENVEAEKPAAKPTILDIFKHKRLRRNSIILFFGWFSIAMTYFGITYGSNNLYGDNFVMFGIGGVAEFIAYILVIFTVNVWGRKNLYCISMILSGVFLVCYGFVPEDLGWLASTIAMIGKLFNCYAYAVAYIYTVEVYPTVIRNAGLGVCSTIARIGTIIAPYINLTIKFWRPCPLLVMGVAILTSGFASLLLPETLNQKLPDTIEDGENFGLKPDNPVEN